MKNILFYSSREINPLMGGIERVTDTLTQYLSQKGYEIVYLALDKTSTSEYECTIPQYFVDKDNTNQQLHDIIKKHHIDIFINQDGGKGVSLLKMLPKDVRTVTVLHDSKYAMYIRLTLGWLRKLRWKYIVAKGLKGCCKYSDKVVIFVDKYIKEIQFFVNDVEDSKFAVIPNFNTYTKPVICKKENRIVWVGRHSEWHKRTTDILKIWSKLEDKFPEWTLDVLGDGPDGDKVRNLHKQLNLKRCTLCGIKDPRPYYEKASVVCMTSAFESFGMVLTEGMQHGCVPVAYDSYTAVRYIIHDSVDGLLVKPFDIDEYAEKLATLMFNAGERKRLSEAAAKSVKQYAAENVMPKWIELIETL